MEQISSRYDNEIDLLELIKAIWDGKLIVVMSALIFTGLGATYTTVVPTIYEVEIKASMHPHADAEILGLVASLSTFKWVIKSNREFLTLETKEPEEPSVYSKDLENAQAVILTETIKFRKARLEQISRLTPASMNTEIISTTILEDEGFLYTFETSGSEPINFSEPKVKIKSPKTRLVVALAFVLGGMIGALSVLIRCAYRNRIQLQQSR